MNPECEVEDLRKALERIAARDSDEFDDVEPYDGLHEHSVRDFAREVLGE